MPPFYPRKAKSRYTDMICPRCKVEFVMGITACVDCQVPLVEEKDLCRECGAVNIRQEICQNCGRVYHQGYRCFNHIDRVAPHVCIVCGFPLCKKCARSGNGRYYCAQHAGLVVSDDGFIEVYATRRPAEAEFLALALEERDIECQVLSFEEVNARFEIVHRLPTRLLVPKDRFRTAQDFISNLYVCSHCGAAGTGEGRRCYNCKSSSNDPKDLGGE